MPENFLNVREAASVIGCTEGRICQLLRAGVVRGEKLNERAWLIYRDSAEAYARSPRLVGRPRTVG